MVGGRYSQSLDIGRELEKEKEEEKEPLPCVCSPDLKKKEGSEPEKEEKAEEARAESPAEKASEPEKAEDSLDEEGFEPADDVQAEPAGGETAANCADEAPKGAVEGETSQPEQPLKGPDPVEEDIEAIITKEIPDLKQKKSIWALLLLHSWVFWVVFVVVVSGMFWVWSYSQHTAGQEKEMLPVKPVILPQAPVSSATETPTATDAAAAKPESPAEPVVSQAVVGAAPAGSQNDSAKALAELLAEGLET